MLSRHRMRIRYNYHLNMVAEVVLRLPSAACRNGASQHHHGKMEEQWRNRAF